MTVTVRMTFTTVWNFIHPLQKHAYSRLVDSKIRVGINHIDQLGFLEAYPLARIEAFKPESIKNMLSTVVPYSAPI